jgi:hypothetical protein
MTDEKEPISITLQVVNRAEAGATSTAVAHIPPAEPEDESLNFWQRFLEGIAWSFQNPEIFIKWMVVLLALKLFFTEGFNWQTVERIINLGDTPAADSEAE